MLLNAVIQMINLTAMYTENRQHILFTGTLSASGSLCDIKYSNKTIE